MYRLDAKLLLNLKKLRDLLKNREIYVVGGSVRDALLKREINDVDIVVIGIKAVELFKRLRIGIPVVLDEDLDEVRLVFDRDRFIDVNGEMRSIEENLHDRDFTINAMAVKLDDFLEGNLNVIDPYGGYRDLMNRVLRKVKDSSLTEDRVRVLRGFRFMLYYSLKPAPGLLDEFEGLTFDGVAGERIRYEMVKILSHNRSSKVVPLMYYRKVFLKLFPLSEPMYRDRDLSRHSLRTYIVLERLLNTRNFLTSIDEIASYIEDDWKIPFLKLAALFHDIGKPFKRFERDGEVHFYGHDTYGARIMADMMRELKFSNREIKYVKTIIERHMHLHLLATAPVLTDRAIRRFFRILGEFAYPIMLLTYADGYATAGVVEHIEVAVDRMIRLKREDERKMKRKRIVTGYDLMDIGIPPGPIYREILEEVEDMYLEGRLKSKDECIEWIRSKYNRFIRKVGS